MRWDPGNFLLKGNQISVSDLFTSQILRRYQSATGESIGAVYKVTWPCICCDLLAYTATESSFTYAQQAQLVYFSVAVLTPALDIISITPKGRNKTTVITIQHRPFLQRGGPSVGDGLMRAEILQTFLYSSLTCGARSRYRCVLGSFEALCHYSWVIKIIWQDRVKIQIKP